MYKNQTCIRSIDLRDEFVFMVNNLKSSVMPWTKRNYPDSMKNLPAPVRNKAIEIGNALIEESDMDEGIAIATAISRAKEQLLDPDAYRRSRVRDLERLVEELGVVCKPPRRGGQLRAVA